MGAFLHMSVFRVTPERGVAAIGHLLDRFASRDDCPVGLHRSWLLESVDEPGVLVWMAWWDSSAASQAFLTGMEYARRISGLGPFLLSAPAWYGYRMLENWQSNTEGNLKEVRWDNEIN